jgi:CubicO group peptidase (beta-lactamase class C family)
MIEGRAPLPALPKTAALLEQAQHDGVFPSYSLGVYLRGSVAFSYSGCGKDSLFDLASLTKVLCTATLCAIAEERGILSIDRPVRDFFELPATAPHAVKLSHLLNHTSGLSAWLPLHALFHDEHGLGPFNALTTPALARARYEKEILASWKSDGFEKEPVYSDLGILLVGWALEKAAGAPLDALFQEWIVLPTQLESLQFLPVSPDVVPTEDCPWRGHVLRGEVHDDNTYVLGGVAPHAGLFGQVRDVVSLGLIWLDAYLGRSPRSLITAESAKRYWTLTHSKQGSRFLGWDGVTPGASSTGRFFSAASRGHLGYTGTSLWIDPEKDLIVSLLTNRVHPTRTNEKIKAFRPIFHDTLLTELGLST